MMPKLRVSTHWLTQVKYHLGDRKHSPNPSGSRKCSAFIKTQANREARRNAKQLINFELELLGNGELK